MLLYGERIGRSVRRVIPGAHDRRGDYTSRIQHAVYGYVQGQFIFSLIMGTSAGVMVYVLGLLDVFPDGRSYAVFFGIFFGLAELIPYVGPVIGALPPILVALFSATPLDGLWVAIAFIVLQQIEGHVVAPNVFAQALRINPILVILALLLGGQLYGIVGALVALPVAAILRETYVYYKGHLVFEPWGTPSADELIGLGVVDKPGVITASRTEEKAEPDLADDPDNPQDDERPAEVDASDSSPNEIDAEPSPGVKVCPHCNASVPDGIERCTSCAHLIKA
jgi:hypothetical protein